MNIFSRTFNTLENALQYSDMKQQVISNNIANVDTPNYKAKDVTFKNTLNQALSNNGLINKNNNGEMRFEETNNNLPYAITTQTGNSYNDNGNSVDVDEQMSELASNQIYYSALTDRLNGMFHSLETVIKGGNA